MGILQFICSKLISLFKCQQRFQIDGFVFGFLHFCRVNFIKQELNNMEVPIVLGEILHFLAINQRSSEQPVIRKIAAISIFVCCTCSIVALLALLPTSVTRFLVRNSVGKSWSSTAVDAFCNNLLQLLEPPDWAFLREKQSQIAFLFEDDYHCGPRQMSEESDRSQSKSPMPI
ncbi:hypothetical protein OROHE_022923 [Orobanche hederae]